MGPERPLPGGGRDLERDTDRRRHGGPLQHPPPRRPTLRAHEPGRAAQPADGSRSRPAGGCRVARGRGGGRGRPAGCVGHRRQAVPDLPAPRREPHPRLRPRRHAGRRGRGARPPQRQHPGRRRGQGTAVARLLPAAARHVPARSRDGRTRGLPGTASALRRGRLRPEAGPLHLEGRHLRSDVHRPSRRLRTRREHSRPAQRLRRVQRLPDPAVQPPGGAMARGRRRLRRCHAPRRQRVRRGLAPGRNAPQQADRLRRLHLGRRMADRRGLQRPGPSGDPRRQQRRPARGRFPHPAAGPLPRRPLRLPRTRPDPLLHLHGSEQHARPARIRRRRDSGPVRVPARLLAVPGDPRRRRLPRRHADPGRPRHPGAAASGP